jgi:hypothetical protein
MHREQVKSGAIMDGARFKPVGGSSFWGCEAASAIEHGETHGFHPDYSRVGIALKEKLFSGSSKLPCRGCPSPERHHIILEGTGFLRYLYAIASLFYEIYTPPSHSSRRINPLPCYNICKA